VLFCYSLPQIYEEFYHTVNNADHEKDLKWWSNTHGVNMAMNWPYFEVNNEFMWENTFFGCIHVGCCGIHVCFYNLKKYLCIVILFNFVAGMSMIIFIG
jgi:hypothetical protein